MKIKMSTTVQVDQEIDFIQVFGKLLNIGIKVAQGMELSVNRCGEMLTTAYLVHISQLLRVHTKENILKVIGDIWDKTFKKRDGLI